MSPPHVLSCSTVIGLAPSDNPIGLSYHLRHDRELCRDLIATLGQYKKKDKTFY